MNQLVHSDNGILLSGQKKRTIKPGKDVAEEESSVAKKPI